MKIERVSYSTLVNTGNYENRKISCDAVVEDGDTPESALAQVKRWVEKEHARAAGETEAVARVATAQERLVTMRDRLKAAAYQAQIALDALNVPIDLEEGEMPF